MSASATDRARVWGSPGSRARAVGIMRVTWPILLLSALIGFALGQALPIPGVTSAVAGLALIVLAIALLRALNWSRDRMANYIRGARGEETVSRHLGLLPAGYDLYNSLHLGQGPEEGTGDLDHVVTGPTGIFVIETKNWRGVISSRDDGIYVDGLPVPSSPAEQVREEAALLTDWIRRAAGVSVETVPVLCFVDGRLSGGERSRSGSVNVCTADALTAFITAADHAPPNPGILHRVNEALQARIREQDGAFA